MTKTVRTAAHIALLAPLPLEHLVSGEKKVDEVGRVAFASGAWELFRILDALRKRLPVDVYIYASDDADGRNPEVSWCARYIRHVEGEMGAHPDGVLYRPKSKVKYPGDNSGDRPVFWEVEDLHRLPKDQRISLEDLTGFGKKKAYGYGFFPRGPVLIEHPFMISC